MEPPVETNAFEVVYKLEVKNAKNTIYKKHLSIIAFRRPALEKFANSKPTPLEEIEGIELLRAIEIGLKVGTFEEYGETLSVDTSEDYERVQRLMCKDELYLESNGYD